MRKARQLTNGKAGNATQWICEANRVRLFNKALREVVVCSAILVLSLSSPLWLARLRDGAGDTIGLIALAVVIAGAGFAYIALTSAVPTLRSLRRATSLEVAVLHSELESWPEEKSRYLSAREQGAAICWYNVTDICLKKALSRL